MTTITSAILKAAGCTGLLAVIGCVEFSCETSTDDYPEPTDWEVLDISFDAGPFGSDPCANVTAIEWLENDELVFSAGENMVGWDLPSRKPLWAIRSPICERIRNVCRETGGEVSRIVGNTTGRDLLVSGWCRNGASFLFHITPGVRVIELFDSPSISVQDQRKLGNTGNAYWSPDGSKYAFGGEDYIEVFNADGTPSNHFTSSNSGPCSDYRVHRVLTWSPDSMKLAGTKCPIGPLEIWDVATGAVIGSLQQPGSIVTRAAWGEVLTVKNNQHKIIGYNGEIEWKEELSSRENEEPNWDDSWYFHPASDFNVRLKMNNSGDMFIAEQFPEDNLTVFNSKGEIELAVPADLGEWRPDGKAIAVTYHCDGAFIWSVDMKKLVSRIIVDDCEFPHYERGFLWSRSGRYLAYRGRKTNRLGIIDVSDNRAYRISCEAVEGHRLRGRLVEADDVSIVVK
jgi:hypothetical protein